MHVVKFVNPCVEVLPRIVNDCEGDRSMLPGVVEQGTEKSISLHTKKLFHCSVSCYCKSWWLISIKTVQSSCSSFKCMLMCLLHFLEHSSVRPFCVAKEEIVKLQM